MCGKKKRMIIGLMVVLVMLAMPMTVLASGEEVVAQSSMYGTFWALVPPIVAIVLALITKEVYSSLFVGIVMGALFYAEFNPEQAVLHLFNGGMLSVLSSSGNVCILIFLVILGAIVCLMNKAGGSAAFGRWAAKRIKSKVGAQIATVCLGILIFVDDYFNCLTVGSVMKPIADKHKVSKEKLAYLIDATAAPICIIAPISSWAAAVAGYIEGEDSLTLFIKAIPFNFYALLTIFMLFASTLLKADFGAMRKKELEALAATAQEIEDAKEEQAGKRRGGVIDLLVPVISLIVCCVIGIIYTGGFFSGTDLFTAFENSSSSFGLVLGSFFALLITFIFYLIRRVLNLKQCMECLPEGFKAMVPAILILTFAWTLNAITASLGSEAYVTGILKDAKALMSFLPAIVFVIACVISFSTGTSWGTFGILIPIVVSALSSMDYQLMIISISACMAGSVCGDHCSPISDTTIMASAGAGCNHVNHVSTQLPYAIMIAVISFVVYILAGFVKTAWICLPVGFALVLGALFLIKYIYRNKEQL